MLKLQSTSSGFVSQKSVFHRYWIPVSSKSGLLLLQQKCHTNVWTNLTDPYVHIRTNFESFSWYFSYAINLSHDYRKHVWLSDIELWCCTSKTKCSTFTLKIINGIVNTPWIVRNEHGLQQLTNTEMQQSLEATTQNHVRRLNGKGFYLLNTHSRCVKWVILNNWKGWYKVKQLHQKQFKPVSKILNKQVVA